MQRFFKISVPKNFARKRLCWSFSIIKLQVLGLHLYKKMAPARVFSCEIYETFKDTYFYRTPPVGASVFLEIYKVLEECSFLVAISEFFMKIYELCSINVLCVNILCFS